MYDFDIFSFYYTQEGKPLRAGILARLLFAKRKAGMKRNKQLKRTH